MIKSQISESWARRPTAIWYPWCNSNTIVAAMGHNYYNLEKLIQLIKIKTHETLLYQNILY